MSRAVVEVGPVTIRGPNPVATELVWTALEAIDDDLALIGESAVPVPELWTDLMRTAMGDVDTALLVCPTWWPSGRIDRVRRSTAPAVKVIGRTALLQRRDPVTVVEIALELTLITRPDARPVVIAHTGDDVADKVVAAAGPAGPVLIDAPVSGALAGAIANRLRGNRIQVRLVDEGDIRRAAETPPDDTAPTVDANRSRRTAALVGVVAATAALCGGFALRGGDVRTAGTASTLLVDGRVQVTVPASWTVEHITTGPGSARVQITAPSGEVALHVTQSVGPSRADLAQTAATLRAALSDEPRSVFVDFDPSGSPVGRAAVTYRELRPDHHVAWAVVLDDGVRIAIGCQSAPGRELAVREVCDQAIRSARTIS
ncbi:type VII secretion-associated protein [Mycolicibacterium celeriflavum]|uniref:type VII secretion-associated protein n=1 Tax=Mycolicibacterium celeriflavum TaxID=1249101 RepID=UPI003CF248D9